MPIVTLSHGLGEQKDSMTDYSPGSQLGPEVPGGQVQS